MTAKESGLFPPRFRSVAFQRFSSFCLMDSDHSKDDLIGFEISGLISKLAHTEAGAVNWKWIVLQRISLNNGCQIALPFLERKII